MRTIQGQRRIFSRLALLISATLLTACERPKPSAEWHDSAAVLSRIGKRLSHLKSAEELTRIAAREDRLIPLLNAEERDLLGRCHLRFQVDRPVSLFVATDDRHTPFWLADQGFKERPERLRVEKPDWRLFEKHVAAGTVELGVDRLDLSTVEHYQVFLGTDFDARAKVSNLSDPRWKVETASGDALPEILRGTTRLTPDPDLRNSTALARGRVWKTHVVAGDLPDQVHLTPGLDPSTELVFTWRTEPSRLGTVLQWREPGRPESASKREGVSQVLKTPSVVNDPEVRIHHVRLSGLKSNHAIEYRVGDGTDEGMSPWATIQTAPGRGEDLQLMSMGDPQCGLEGWGKLLASARKRHPKAAALLIAGDLVDRGNERTNWDHFFLRASGTFDGLPIVPAVGNHEYLDRGPRLYQSFFQNPANGPEGLEPGLAYALEYGDAFIAVLDSTIAHADPRSAAAQGKWLESRLSSTRCPWKIVMFHHPLYVSHPWRENLGLRDAWAPILERNGVDLVLLGHDHAYLRTYPMRNGRPARSINDGTTYVVSVSGDKFCEQRPRDYAEVAFTNRSTYQTIDVKPKEGTMILRAFDLSGKELDRAEWRKKASTPSVARR